MLLGGKGLSQNGLLSGLQRARTPPPPNLADAVWQRVGEMRRGALRIDPLTCDYCDLKPVCRVVALPNEDDEAGRG